MARLKLFLPLLLVLLLGVVFYSVLSNDEYNPQELPSALAGKDFPEFSLPDLFDLQSNLTHEDLLGEPFLFNIWASWCPTCYYEHPYLMDLKKKGIKIIGLNYKDDAGKALNILEESGNPYQQVIFDVEGFLGLELGVTGAPETFVVDRNGIVRMRYQGAVDQQSWDRKFAELWQEVNKQ